MRRLMLLFTIASGCSTAARAEPEPIAAAGSESGGHEAIDDELDAPEDEPTDEPAELEAARAKVDAAIVAAADRGEADRLAIAQQKHELAALQTELDARLAGVERLEGKIDELLGAGKVAEDRRRERTDLLATLIASMSPQSAATVLAQMSDGEAQDLLFAVAQSDKRRAAKLIATMPAGRAAAIGQRYLSKDPKAVDESEPPPKLPPPSAAAAPSKPAEPPAMDEGEPAGGAAP
ncbi:MAG TPA: hypothetical protein VG755_29325 [Nannocystaceae bacterium]|nr:hypothetical protein [Nannocystaceae bacterium]